MSNDFKTFFEQMQSTLADNAHAGRVRFTSDSHQVEGVRSTVRLRNFELVVDEPPALSGTDQGPNPVELILAALGTCQEITYRFYADKMDIPLHGVAVTVKGSLDLRGFFAVDDEVRPGYKEIEAEVRIDSPASAEDIARLVEEVERHCPVLDCLSRGVPVKSKVAHRDASGVRTAVA
ncbi:OsmC family protein [Haliangium ochraceum]|uniref:OsmC family protein n=1 Tax=Haliangium ochraceum (strain DSM 14365 / JCM 11303 / SMP-2) TaxID=502025 RepID=D0LW96_HALO1|nr:OsmC family protein [Haliangium ochraceum]ACY16028.1 OsmC family protein [Haliangium ochraceum DSM 14365]